MCLENPAQLAFESQSCSVFSQLAVAPSLRRGCNRNSIHVPYWNKGRDAEAGVENYIIYFCRIAGSRISFALVERFNIRCTGVALRATYVQRLAQDKFKWDQFGFSFQRLDFMSFISKRTSFSGLLTKAFEGI